MKKFMTFKQELTRLEKQISKLPPISKKEDELIDRLANLLVDDFLEREAAGTLPKHVKRERKSVRK